MSSPAPITQPPSLPASWRFALVVLLCGIAAQWAVYRDSFGILPASDDFPIVNEIHRGNREGVAVFFTRSAIQIGYRPLKSLAIWGFGNLNPQHPMVAVRLLNLLAAAGCGAVALLWARSLKLGRSGTAAAILVAMLHPIMTAAIASCDGIDTVASTALLWLGAWCVFRFRDRIVPATLLALACFLVGVGFKENAYALVPLSVMTILAFWSTDRRIRAAGVIGAILAFAAVGMFELRRHVIVTGLSPGLSMLRFNPVQLGENAGIFLTGLLFFGDTIRVFLNRSAPVLAALAMCMLAALAIIVLGIRLRLGATSDVRRAVGFLVIGMMIASFPAILLFHVSEMYVPPMVIPFALLCGIAADGWRAARPLARCVAVTFVLIALVSSVLAIDHKIAGLREVGFRAANQIDQILELLPPDAHDLSVAVLFDAEQLPPNRRYSVFKMGDEILLVHRDVLDWPRPGKNLVLISPALEDVPGFDISSVDIALRWDVPSRRFVRIK